MDAKLLPAAVSGICTEIIVGMTMHRVGNRIFLMLGAFAFVISNTLLSASSEHITYWALKFPALILMTAGADFLFTVTNVYVLSHLPTEQQSSGSGILITTSRFSSTIGLGIQTSTFTSLGGRSSGLASRLYRSYQSGFWVSLSTSALALFLLPFVTLGRQGAELKARVDDPEKSMQMAA
jgi:MFS family permease